MLIPFRLRRSQRSSAADTFDRQVQPYLADLYRFAYRLSGQREDAEDLVQDVLVKLYRRREDLSQLADPAPWLHRVLYHQFIDQIRYRDRRPPLNADEDLLTELPGSEEPVAAAELGDVSRRIDEALQTLSADQRALVALHLIEGHTLDHLAAVLDTPVGTLKSRLHRAKAQLRSFLDDREPSATNARDIQDTASNGKGSTRGHPDNSNDEPRPIR
jgi:RNA polymerase sigma factor (sigma-70 family)